MRAIIDTSSLLVIARYFLPFDRDNLLKNFFQKKVEEKEIIILDKVSEESQFIAQGTIIKSLEFIGDKKNQIKTDNILATKKFINDLENRLCYAAKKNLLEEKEFEKYENNFLESADAKLILYCLKNAGQIEFDRPFIVTEETRMNNDVKLFKKIPEICELLKIDHCNITALLKDRYKIRLSEYLM